MKAKYILSLLAFAAALLTAASPVGYGQVREGHSLRADSLLKVLDHTLRQRDLFEERLRDSIEGVRTALPSARDAEQKYRVGKRLIDIYRSYIYDSAMYYVAMNRELARECGENELINENRIDYCNMLLSGGMYHEAIENLRAIPRHELHGDQLVDYWLCCDQTYHHMSLYTAGSLFEEEYRRISAAYIDSLAMRLEENTEHYFALSRVYICNPDRGVARTRLERLLERLEPGSHDYAIVSATLADTYDERIPGENEQKMEYLAVSAISDVKSNVKEYVSLSSLGGLLYLAGDVQRAYRYGVISMEDANFYNARLRRIELSRIFPIIESAYKRELDRQNARLRLWSIMVSILAALMLALIIYGTRQTVLLRRVRRKLLSTNDRLIEAGRVKEEYLGRVLRMCSSYINRLERYQQTINTKLSAGKVEEVRVMVRSSDVINHEISEFYRSFDKAFLKLYPDFIADLNSLLRDDEQIKPREGELLTTEARIYALVRLGISNPADIAKFLRYSANTVYTYRHKVRSKAKCKETFEEDLLNMGV